MGVGYRLGSGLEGVLYVLPALATPRRAHPHTRNILIVFRLTG
jgi:hypothetical protein